jgi:hypothetical protein
MCESKAREEFDIVRGQVSRDLVRQTAGSEAEAEAADAGSSESETARKRETYFRDALKKSLKMTIESGFDRIMQESSLSVGEKMKRGQAMTMRAEGVWESESESESELGRGAAAKESGGWKVKGGRGGGGGGGAESESELERGAAVKKSGGWKVKGGGGGLGGTPGLAAAAAKSGRQAKTGAAAPPLFGEVRVRYREND